MKYLILNLCILSNIAFGQDELAITKINFINGDKEYSIKEIQNIVVDRENSVLFLETKDRTFYPEEISRINVELIKPNNRYKLPANSMQLLKMENAPLYLNMPERGLMKVVGGDGSGGG